MEHASIDATIELEAFGVAAEDGEFGSLIAARLVVALVNPQMTFQLFQSAFHGNHLVIFARIETQRIDFGHVDGKVFVLEGAVLGEKLKHPRQDSA